MRRHRIVLTSCCLLVALGSFWPSAPVAGPEEVDAAPPVHGDLQFLALNRLQQRDLPVKLSYHAVTVDVVLKKLAETAGFQVLVEGELPLQKRDLDRGTVPLKRALQLVSGTWGVAYRVPDANTLVVGLPAAIGVWKPPALDPDTHGGPRLVGPDGVTRPILILSSKVSPVYPEQARQDKLQGTVMLQALIGEDGAVNDVEVMHSTQPGAGLEEAAIEAVKQWRYEPATQHGEPVAVYFTLKVEFKLE